jgi:hypothetical protein
MTARWAKSISCIKASSLRSVSIFWARGMRYDAELKNKIENHPWGVNIVPEKAERKLNQMNAFRMSSKNLMLILCIMINEERNSILTQVPISTQGWNRSSPKSQGSLASRNRVGQSQRQGKWSIFNLSMSTLKTLRMSKVARKAWRKNRASILGNALWISPGKHLDYFRLLGTQRTSQHSTSWAWPQVVNPSTLWMTLLSPKVALAGTTIDETHHKGMGDLTDIVPSCQIQARTLEESQQ